MGGGVSLSPLYDTLSKDKKHSRAAGVVVSEESTYNWSISMERCVYASLSNGYLYTWHNSLSSSRNCLWAVLGIECARYSWYVTRYYLPGIYLVPT